MNLLIDISHLLKWEGRLTGIERVEFNFVNFYLSKDAGFIYWDEQTLAWIKATTEFVEQNIINRSQNPKPVDNKSIVARIRNKLNRVQTQADGETLSVDGAYILVPAGLWDNEGYIRGLEQLAIDNHILHVVHDMIPILRPGYVVDYLPKVFSEYMYRILPMSNTLLANSENTKRDTVEVLRTAGLPVPPILVFRLGDDIEIRGDDRKPDGVPSDYLLSVGTIEARKNHQLLAYVYRLAQERAIELPPIVIAGRRGWHTDNFLQMVETDPYLKTKIIVMDDIDDESLRWLYRNAILTVFPSLYEGWGLPVAESLAYGKVTLSSSISSMPEVGNDAADYFSPNSPEELLTLAVKYSDKRGRNGREGYVKDNFKLVSWSEALDDLNFKLIKLEGFYDQ